MPGVVLAQGNSNPRLNAAPQAQGQGNQNNSQQREREKAQRERERERMQAQRQRERAQAQANAQAQAQTETAAAPTDTSAVEQMRETGADRVETAQENAAEMREQAAERVEAAQEATAPVNEEAQSRVAEAQENAEEMREQAAERVETAQEGAAEMREETAKSATARVEANTEAEMSAEERALAAQQRVEQMKAGEEVSTSAAAETQPSTEENVNPRMTVTDSNEAETTTTAKTTAETDAKVAANAEAKAKQREQRKKAAAKMDRETRQVLEDNARRRDRSEDRQRAERIDDDDDAENLIYSILGGAAAGAIAGNLASRDRYPQRLPSDQVGRSDRDRRDSVAYLKRRFRGDADWNDAPPGYYGYDDRRGHDGRHHRHPHYFEGNRRVVWYDNRNSIPPILLASNRLNRVQMYSYQDSPYRRSQAEVDQTYYNNIPDGYQSEGSYAVSYEVDPESVVSRDDILFQQGSTAFADAYSFDIVTDLAEAMNSSELQSENFIVEGHASSEGDYSSNLRLSQERAERIARDLVDMGVKPDRLIPVGYGETEAQYPADAAENLRSLDRRVMVFRAE